MYQLPGISATALAVFIFVFTPDLPIVYDHSEKQNSAPKIQAAILKIRAAPLTKKLKNSRFVRTPLIFALEAKKRPATDATKLINRTTQPIKNRVEFMRKNGHNMMPAKATSPK